MIFNNFMQKDLLDEDNTFRKLKEVEYGEAEFVVYTTN
jgi:hypothetical protein